MMSEGASPEKTGLICPGCGEDHSAVSYTRRRRGYVARRRRCGGCGAMFTTSERVVGAVRRGDSISGPDRKELPPPDRFHALRPG